MMNGPVAFMDVRRIESALLKLAIDVARENAEAMRHLRAPAQQEVVAVMRHRLPIERQPMTIEAPSTFGR